MLRFSIDTIPVLIWGRKLNLLPIHSLKFQVPHLWRSSISWSTLPLLYHPLFYDPLIIFIVVLVRVNTKVWGCSTSNSIRHVPISLAWYSLCRWPWNGLALRVDLGEEVWERPVEYTRGDRAARSQGEEMCHVTSSYLHEHWFTTKQLRWSMCVYMRFFLFLGLSCSLKMCQK